MSQDLFRREVLEAQRTGWLGDISLSQPLRLWVLTAFACIAALAIALYLALGSYTRRSTVAGRLVPARGLATVLAPAAGVVGELHVAEGTRVTAGQALAVIAVPRVTVASGTPSTALDASLRGREDGVHSAQDGQLRAIAAEATGLNAQLAATRDELAQLEAEIGTREQQMRIGEQTLARMRELYAKQYVSQLQLNQQQAAVLDQTGTLQELRRQRSATRRGILQLRQSLDELPGRRKTVEAGASRDLAALAQERVEMKAPGMLVIAAPVTGVVATQIAKAGQAVQQGQPLLTVLPGDGRLEAELLVPSRAIGFIAPGDTVLLRYQAFPWQKFGHQRGRVTAVSRSALSPGELGALLGGTAGGQPLYRVTVALATQAVRAYGRAEALKPGMLLDADILGDTRRLSEWLFEPLVSLKGRFTGHQES
jgi:membrane fusion protein